MNHSMLPVLDALMLCLGIEDDLHPAMRVALMDTPIPNDAHAILDQVTTTADKLRLANKQEPE
jgi:hypothetical protein